MNTQMSRFENTPDMLVPVNEVPPPVKGMLFSLERTLGVSRERDTGVSHYIPVPKPLSPIVTIGPWQIASWSNSDAMQY